METRAPGAWSSLDLTMGQASALYRDTRGAVSSDYGKLRISCDKGDLSHVTFGVVDDPHRRSLGQPYIEACHRLRLRDSFSITFQLASVLMYGGYGGRGE